MRLLYLHRPAFAPTPRWFTQMAEQMPRHGHFVHLEEANWIPNETGPRSDREVGARLKKLGEDFDLIHVYGYRAAWACAEAFGRSVPWVYSAADSPATKHAHLIQRLNKARGGYLADDESRYDLADAGAMRLQTVYPCVEAPPSDLPSAETVREIFGLPAGAAVVTTMPEWTPRSGVDKVVLAMQTVWETQPEAWLLLAGQGPLEETVKKLRWELPKAEQVVLAGPALTVWDALLASDVVVDASEGRRFSPTAARAMALGRAVMVRDTEGLRDMVEAHLSGFTFFGNENMGGQLAEVLAMPYTLGAVGASARNRFAERFDLGEAALAMSERYERLTAVNSTS